MRKPAKRATWGVGLLAGLGLALTAPLALASPLSFSNMYVFGDSLSDTGNTADVAGRFPPINNLGGYGPNERFSNGPVWHEYLAVELGLQPATNSRSGGENYAYGGARINDASTGPSRGLLYQGEQYLNGTGANGSDPDGLYIAWGGGNDMRDLVGSADPIPVIDTVLGRYRDLLSDIIGNGARTLLVPNLPDLGAIPEFAGNATQSASATAVTMAYNEGVSDLLLDLSADFTGDIFALDVFSIFDSIVKGEGDVSFGNTTDQCRSVIWFGLVEQSCPNADDFVFWDAIHPTTAAHGVLGGEAYKLLKSGRAVAAVPEPATLLLLAIGLLVLVRQQSFKMQS